MQCTEVGGTRNSRTRFKERTWFGSVSHVGIHAMRLAGRQPNQVREFRTRAAHFETTSGFASFRGAPPRVASGERRAKSGGGPAPQDRALRSSGGEHTFVLASVVRRR